MLGSLDRFSETELLNIVSLILSKPDSVMSAFDHTELDQINEELIRRGHSGRRNHQLKEIQNGRLG